jgi:hypothetical protein
MFWLVVLLLLFAMAAYYLGYRGLYGFNMKISKWLVPFFVVFAILVLMIGGGQ